MTGDGNSPDPNAEEDQKEGEKQNESSDKVSEKLDDGNDISNVPVIPPGSGSPLPEDKEDEEVHQIKQNLNALTTHTRFEEATIKFCELIIDASNNMN